MGKAMPTALVTITDRNGVVCDYRIRLLTAQLDNPQSIQEAIYKACNDYKETDRGKKDFESCGSEFNYKFITYKLPVDYCAYAGFEILSTELKVNIQNLDK